MGGSTDAADAGQAPGSVTRRRPRSYGDCAFGGFRDWMEVVMLAGWGRMVHRHRWVVLVLSIGLVALSIAGILKGVSPNFNGDSTNTEASTAQRLMTSELPAQDAPSLTLLYRGGALTAASPEFRSALEASVQP